MSNVVRSKKKKTAWNRRSRVNVENELDFKQAFSHKLTIPISDVYKFGTGNFAFSFFLTSKSDVSSCYVLNLTNPNLNIYISNNGTLLRCTVNGTTTGNIVLVPNKKVHIAAQRVGLFWEVWVNGRRITNDSVFLVGTVNDFNTSFIVGEKIGFANNYGNFLISHLSIFNTNLLEVQISYTHKNGGIIHPAVHKNCVAYYPLNHRYGDLAYDVVSQFNYAKNWSLPRFDSGTWTVSSNDPAFSFAGNTVIYDGTAPGSRAATANVTNLLTTDSVWIRVKFNISAITGGGVQVFIGGTASAGVKKTFNTTGIKEIWLYKEAGTSTSFFFNNSVDIAATWTIEDPEIIGYPNVNGALINFTNRWYANHAFDANGYASNPYCTFSTTVGGEDINMSVIFNTDNVEFLANAPSQNNTGLRITPFINVVTGARYIVEIDWEYIESGTSTSTTGVEVFLGFSTDLYRINGGFGRTTQNFEILCVNGGSRPFNIRHASGVETGDSLKIYSVKIWEKGKEPGVDSEPTGVPLPASNKAWQDFYSKSELTEGLCFNKLNEFNANTISYCFQSNPENLGDATTGILPSNSSFNLMFIGSFMGLDSGNPFSGAGQVILAFNTISSFFALRTSNIFRLSMSGGVLVDFTVPYSFAIAKYHKKPFLINLRYNNATGDVFIAFRFVDSPVVTKQSFLAAGTWSRSTGATAVTSIGSSLAPMALKVHQGFVSETVENEIMAFNFNSLTPVIDWNFKGLISPTAYDNIGNLTPKLYRYSVPAEYVDQSTFDALINPVVEARTGLPEIKQALPLTYNTIVLKLPLGLLTNLTAGDYTIIIDYRLNRPGYPSTRVDLLKTVGGTNGNFFLYSINASFFRAGATGSTNAVSQISNSLIKGGTIQTLYFLKKGTGFRIPDFNFTINANFPSAQNQAVSGNVSPDFSTATDFQLTDDCDIMRIAFFEKQLTEKRIQEYRNNTFLTNRDFSKDNCIGYYLFNDAQFSEDGTDVLCKDLSGVKGDLKITGLAGATSADKLATLKASLLNIDDLR